MMVGKLDRSPVHMYSDEDTGNGGHVGRSDEENVAEGHSDVDMNEEFEEEEDDDIDVLGQN